MKVIAYGNNVRRWGLNPAQKRGRVSRAAEVEALGAVDTPTDRTLAIRAGPCTVRAPTVIAPTTNSYLSTFPLECVFRLTKKYQKSEQATKSFQCCGI